MIIYLAGSRFTLAQRMFNTEFTRTLERCYMPLQVILLEDRGAEIGAMPDFAARMCRFTLDAINRCDAVVAILDGADADSGTCVEMTYAKGKGKLVIGVRTDFRAGEDRGLNLMVSAICTALIVCPSTTTTLDELAEEVAEVLAKHERQNTTGCVPAAKHLPSRTVAAS